MMATEKQNITVYNDLTDEQRVWIGAAVLRTVKLLEDLAKRATDANKPREAARYQAEAEAAKTDLLSRTLQRPLSLGPADRRIVEAGLRVLVRNYRAASGTVLALGEAQWSEECRAKADRIETDLLPEFADQLNMKLVEPTTPADD